MNCRRNRQKPPMNNNDKIRIIFIVMGLMLVFLFAAYVEPCPESSCNTQHRSIQK